MQVRIKAQPARPVRLMGDRLSLTGLAGCALILACILAVQVLPLLHQRWATR